MGAQAPMDRDEVAHAIHRTYEQHGARLERIAKLLEAQTLEIAVGGSPNDRRIDDWPTAGRSRWSISDRRSSGNDGLAIAAGALTPVVAAVPGRIGGLIVNSGPSPAILYLSDSGRAATGVGAVWLSPLGGAWDFLLGQAIWAGPVTALSSAGTTLVIAQV